MKGSTTKPTPMKDVLALSKPGITISNVLMVATGYLAAHRARSLPVVVALLVGTSLIVAAANAFNMVLEQRTDALMPRTRTRPIAAGRLTASAGALIATVWSVLGVACLFWVNTPVALLGAASLIAYAFIYTPLKRHSWLALPVGAVPGAIPPALGVLAADPDASGLALVLSVALFLWQFPHFLAIAVWRRDEYAAAGIKALTVVHGPALTRAISRITALALVPLALLPPVLDAIGPIAAALMAATAAPLALAAQRVNWVRPTFLASLAYLPALFVVVAVRALLS